MVRLNITKTGVTAVKCCLFCTPKFWWKLRFSDFSLFNHPKDGVLYVENPDVDGTSQFSPLILNLKIDSLLNWNYLITII